MPTTFKTDPEMQAGTLSDRQIKNACHSGWLVTGHFEEGNVHQACYELRAGDIYYELDNITSEQNPRRKQLLEEDFILLKPKQLIVIITMESLSLPNNVIGRVLTKGKLLSIGVSAVNTYADPGFKGRLGIIMANLSNNYIRIEQGQAISKIEFSKLRTNVESTYSGQHGYESEMWPVPYELVMSRSDLRNDPRVRTPVEEVEAANGPIIAEISRRMFRYERWLIFSGAAYFVLTGVLLCWFSATNNTQPLSNALAIVLGVVANLITALLTFFATRLGDR